MAELVLQDIVKIYPFTKVKGLFGLHKRAREALLREQMNPYTTNEGVIAVQKFSLSIEHGEFVVILGPSGCGKTTVLRMIAGLEQVSDGNILMDGVQINNMRPETRGIAMIFQNYALYPHLTVYDNIAYTLKSQHMPRDEIRSMVLETAQLLNLSGLLNRRPMELSGGQQQCVAIGRALVRKPKLFLLDEPFSNLDSALRQHLRLELKRIHEQLGTTFIYVTHDQAEAFMLGTKIVVMRDGFIEQSGTPRELYNYPYNTYVASFVGVPQMNLVEARLIKKNCQWYARLFDESYLLPERKCRAFSEAENCRQIILGIRPVHITISDAGVEAQIEYTEHSGNEFNLYLNVGDTAIVVVVPAESNPVRFTRHQKVHLNFSASHFHLFDPESKIRIC